MSYLTVTVVFSHHFENETESFPNVNLYVKVKIGGKNKPLTDPYKARGYCVIIVTIFNFYGAA